MERAVNYAYIYAEIDNATNMCVGVYTSTRADEAGPTSMGTTIVSIDVYNEDYICTYYNWDDGKFYYDDAYTQEYIPE